MRVKIIICLACIMPLLFGAYQLSAAENIYQFETLKQERLFQTLLEELRCPKCQNQNLMDSNSDISQYMKQRIYEMVVEGKSQSEITEYLRARYGDFISYKPPFNWQTAFLWLAPLLALVLGAYIWWRQMQRISSEQK